MTFQCTPMDNPWVTLRKGDASFQLNGPFTLANRASIQINRQFPEHVQRLLRDAIFNGWIEAVATVPNTDPTLIWDTLKK